MAFDLACLVSKGGTIGHKVYISQDLDVVYQNKVIGKLTLDVDPIGLPEEGYKNYPVYDHASLQGEIIHIAGNDNFPDYREYRAVDTIIDDVYVHISRILGTKI
jgi:hypothetical protein